MKFARRHAARLYPLLMGVSAIAIVLQGLWAGVFLEHDGQRDAAGTWIDVHATGGEVAILFAGLAAVVAFLGMRERKQLWVGAGLLTGLLILVAYIGGLIRDDGRDNLTPLHIPLAVAVIALATWLWSRSTTRPAGESTVGAYPGASISSDQAAERARR